MFVNNGRLLAKKAILFEVMMLRQHAFSSSELVSLWSKEYLNPPPLRNRIAPIAETRYSDAHATVQCQIQSLQAAEAQRLQKQSLLNLIVPIDKPWSEVGVSVYRVGVGMYHSSKQAEEVERGRKLFLFS